MSRKSKWAFIAVLLGLLLVAVYFLFPGLTLTLAVKAERIAAGLERQGINVAGDRIEYLTGGTGEPLMLLHGFGADKDNWTRVAKHLTPHFCVIAPDLPGFGESGRNAAASYTVSDQVDRVRAFAQILGLDSFHLGGNSMGGHIASAYAARHPDDVKSLWLLAPDGVTSAKRSELDELLAKGENPLLVDSVEGFERLLDLVFMEQPYIPGPIKRHLAERAIADRNFHDKIFQDLIQNPLPLEPVLKDLPLPTLIVWGDRDRLLHVSGATILESIMPNGHAVVMQNTGHLPMVERPQATAETFLRFHRVEF